MLIVVRFTVLTRHIFPEQKIQFFVNISWFVTFTPKSILLSYQNSSVNVRRLGQASLSDYFYVETIIEAVFGKPTYVNSFQSSMILSYLCLYK